MATIVARQLADGTLVEVLPDGSTRPMRDPMDWVAFDAMTEEEREAAALSDPDAQPLSDAAIERALKGPHPRLVRMKLRLTREEFCARYQIPMDILVAWENRVSQPDDVARAFMKAIMGDPEGVAKALAKRTLDVPPRAAE
jgi:putative transcriptional regulator